MKIIIREGSAARNLNALKPLVKTHPNKIMFCSDDLHPDILAKSHINKIAADLICERYDLFDVIKACCLNPVMHYNLNPGLLLSGQKANFIIVDDYKKMDVLETWINGRKVFDRGKILFPDTGSPKEMNNFNCSPVSAEAILVNASGNTMKVIVAADGDLITKTDTIRVVPGTNVDIDTQQDILKIVVKDRYQDQPPAVAFIKGFGLKKGAVACSIAHDSHNIVCVGSSDVEMVKAINEIVEAKGGMAVVDNDEVSLLKLPVAGLMSTDSVEQTAQKYECLNRKIKTLGCNLKAPFMTLSFMALLVIPEIKLSDRGLFDVKTFNFTSLFENR